MQIFLIWKLQKNDGILLPITMQISRSKVTIKQLGLSPENSTRTRVKTLAAEQSAYGCLLLHDLLIGEGLVANNKKDLSPLYPRKTSSSHREKKEIQRPGQPMEIPLSVNQKWSMNFVSDQISDGRRFRALNVADNYSREIVGQRVSASISGRQVARFLTQFVAARRKPARIICENGIEFTDKALFFLSRDFRIKPGFIHPGSQLKMRLSKASRASLKTNA